MQPGFDENFKESENNTQNHEKLNTLLMKKNNSGKGKEIALRNLQRIDPLFSGGGCFSIIKREFIRSLPVSKFIDALVHTGAIWSHRWADQAIMPRIAAIFLENPHNSSYLLHNIELMHHSGTYFYLFFIKLIVFS